MDISQADATTLGKTIREFCAFLYRQVPSLKTSLAFISDRDLGIIGLVTALATVEATKESVKEATEQMSLF